MKYVTLIAFLVFFQETYGQGRFDKYTNYLSIKGSVLASSGGLAIGPTFSVFRDGHKFEVGIGAKFFDVWKDGPGILGSHLGYKYYPSKRKNDFSMYFGYYNLFSAHQTGKRFPVILDPVTNASKSPTNTFILENLIGLGFDYQIGDKLIWFMDFSVGAVVEWNQFEDAETENEVRSTGLIRTGFGYLIGAKKAP